MVEVTKNVCCTRKGRNTVAEEKRYGHTGARKCNLGGRNANQHLRGQNYVRCACEMQEQNGGFGRCASDYDDNRKITFCDAYCEIRDPNIGNSRR